MEGYFIEEDNIGLRSIRKEDEIDFLRWHNNSKMREKIGGVFPFTENTFHEICTAHNENYPSDIWFAVCVNNNLTGIAGFHYIKYIQRNAELALFIGEENIRKQGIGSKTLKLLEEYAFNTLNLHRIYVNVYSDNLEARKFFQKNQWQEEGILRDAIYWKNCFRNVVIYAKLKD